MDEEDIHLILIVEEVVTMIKTFLLLVYFYRRHFMARRVRRRHIARLAHTPENTPETPPADVQSSFQVESGATGKTKSSKKRKASADVEERFLDLMASFCEKTNLRLGDLARRIGFEQDAASSRRAVFDALQGMHFLSIEDKIAVAQKLCHETNVMDLFFNLHDDHKAVMVQMMRDGKI